MSTTTETAAIYDKAAETGIVKINDRTYFAILDPRSKYMHKGIESGGGGWSPMDNAYIFPENEKEAFDHFCERIAAMPYLPLDDKLARYAGDELYQMGIQGMNQPMYADNPNGPTKRVYVAPNIELFEQASALVFEKSRATPEQIAKINGGIASGTLTPLMLDGTTKEFNDRLAERKVTQGDANKILSHIEAPAQTQLDKLQELIKSGQLTESHLGFDPNTEPEKMAGLKARGVYDLIDIGKKMATFEEKRHVAAYQNAGAFREEVYLDELTRAQARKLIQTGKQYINGDTFKESLDQINRDGFELSGSTNAYGQKSNQSAEQQSYDRLRSRVDGKEIDGIPADAQAVDFPPHGLVGGEVAYASAFHAVIVTGPKTYIEMARSDIALEKGLDLTENVGKYVAFAVSRGKDKPFGVLTSASNPQEAICELDARNTLSDQKRQFVAANEPAQAVSGRVIATRGEYGSIDLGGAGVLTRKLTSFSDPAPKYNALVSYTPETPEIAQAPAEQAIGAAKKTGRTR